MLFKERILQGIVEGTVKLAYRRWDEARVKPGSQLLTSVGVVEVTSVEEADERAVTDEQARAAGYATAEELRRELGKRAGAHLYCIALRFAGADPRIGLREREVFAVGEIEELLVRLQRLDKASRDGAWTRRVLELIRKRPGTRAGDLADELGMEKEKLKLDVRKLKNLGLTISLGTGYTISPRGERLLAHLEGREG